MALIKAGVLLKCGQFLSESFILNTRSLSLARSRTFTTATDEQKKSESEPSPPEIDSKIKEELDKLNGEIEKLNKTNTDLMDKYKRALADGENMRKRMLGQIEETKVFAIQKFSEDLLDVADGLHKATELVPKEEINDNNPHLKNLFDGLTLLRLQLHNVFKRHELETVDPLDEKFDSKFHQAVFQTDVEGKESGTVIAVTKIGYKLKERCIRAAIVGVAK